MNPRVGYVIKVFPRFSETFILNELLELERLGVPVTVYSLKAPILGPVHPAVARLGARVVYLPERPLHWLTRGAWAAAKLLARRPAVVLPVLAYVATRRTHQAWKRFLQASCLVQDLRAHPLDRLHAHFASAPARVAMLASRLAGLPFSFTAHAKDIYQSGTDWDVLRDKMRAAEFVVTVSDYNRAYLERLLGDTNGHCTIRRLYNGVDLQLFSPAEREDHGGIVLAVGRLVEKKGFDDLLRAWPRVLARHPHARLVIVGAGPEAARLEDLARALAIAGRVTWAGPEPQERVRAWMARASVLCLPCRIAADGNRDGLPTVLLEAMAVGLPCVSTAVTGIPEILGDGEGGLLVQPGDSEALAEIVAGLLADPERRAVLGAAGRARAEALFDLRRNVGRLASWFRGAA
ncbi:MAG TPA: glycosyltransferase family 4 protein [Candidatus Eisenbacteria bacterium]